MIPNDVLNAVALTQDGNAESSAFMYQMVAGQQIDLQLSYQTFVEMTRVTMNSYLLPSIPCKIFDILYQLNHHKNINDPNWVSRIHATPEYEQYINAIRFYGYTLLVKLMQKRFNQLDVERVKRDLEEFLLSNDNIAIGEYSTLVCQKLAQYISAIALQIWPNNWTNFLPSLMQSIQSQCKSLIFLYLISEISQELNEDANNTIPYNKKTKIAAVLKLNIMQILQIFQQTSASVSDNNFIRHAWISAYRNLSGVIPGELMMLHVDILKSKLMDPKCEYHQLDILQTLYNMCNNLECKNLSGYEHLDGFVKLIASFSLECVNQSIFGDDLTGEIGKTQLVVANIVRNLVEKNFHNLQMHLKWPTIYELFARGIMPLISHPSMEISIIGINTCNVYIKRLYSGSYKLGAEDISRFIAAVYLRILKFGNPAIKCDLKVTESLDSFIQRMYNQLLNMQIENWANLVSKHYQLDDTIVTAVNVGENPIYSGFNSKFATLRVASTNCLTTLANINPQLLNHSIKTLVEIAKLSFSSSAFSMDITNIAANVDVNNQKAIPWIIPKFIIYETICHVFESLISRLSNEIDASGNDWISSAKIFYCEMLKINLGVPNEKFAIALLENRKLEFINNTAQYLLHQTVPIEEVLEYLISLISDSNELRTVSLGNQRATNKIAAGALITVCRTCSGLIPNLIHLIVDKLTCLLQNPKLDHIFIAETLISSISCLKNPSAKRPLVESIISPQINKLVAFKHLMVDCETILTALFGESPANHAGRLGVAAIPEFRDALKRDLIQITSMLKRMDLQEMATLDCINQLLPILCDLMVSFVSIWKPQNIEQNSWEWRKPLLCPGAEELESVQWFSSAISAAQIVNLLFPCGDLPPKFVNSARHDLFAIRSSLFRLLGICSPLYTNEYLINFKSLIAMSYKWMPFSQQSVLLKHFILPLFSDDNLYYLHKCDRIAFLEPFGSLILEVEKLNNEWLSLSHLKKYLENTGDSSGASREKYINLYYMRVHACLDNCSLILSIINAATKWSKNGDGDYVCFKKKIVDSIGDLIVKALTSSLLWPHVDTILEGLRLIKQYLKMHAGICEMFQDAKAKLHYNGIEIAKAIFKIIFVPRNFDPLHLGISNDADVNTEFNHFFSLKQKGEGRCFIQSFTFAIYSIYETLFKISPHQQETLQIVKSLQALLFDGKISIFSAEECDEFVKLIVEQKSIEAKSMLRINFKIAVEIERNEFDPSGPSVAQQKKIYAKKWDSESAFDPKVPEYCTELEGEDSFLGESILSLLLE